MIFVSNKSVIDEASSSPYVKWSPLSTIVETPGSKIEYILGIQYVALSYDVGIG